jgi:hypothetical protein
MELCEEYGVDDLIVERLSPSSVRVLAHETA